MINPAFSGRLLIFEQSDCLVVHPYAVPRLRNLAVFSDQRVLHPLPQHSAERQAQVEDLFLSSILENLSTLPRRSHSYLLYFILLPYPMGGQNMGPRENPAGRHTDSELSTRSRAIPQQSIALDHTIGS